MKRFWTCIKVSLVLSVLYLPFLLFIAWMHGATSINGEELLGCIGFLFVWIFGGIIWHYLDDKWTKEDDLRAAQRLKERR